MSFTHSVKFLGQPIIGKYIFNTLEGILVWISPLDCAPGNFGQGIIVIKLMLVDFDGHDANITLKIRIHIVYIHVYVVPILNTSRRRW